jgi:putative hemolysin
LELLFDILVILALVAAGGVYAAVEIAVVYLRPSRVKELAEKKVPGARDIEELQRDPQRFFAIIQIGITLVGTLASATGGAAAVKLLEPALRAVPVKWVNHWSPEIAMTIVVVVVSYLFLVLGELVPKTLAMRHPEKIALLFAKPVHLTEHILSPVVWFLSKSQAAMMRLIPGMKAEKGQNAVSEGELKILIDEGRRSGAIGAAEHDIMSAAFDFADRQVRDVMVPRERVVAVPESISPAALKLLVMEEHHTRYPVHRGGIDNIVGLIHARDVFYTELQPGMVSMADIVRAPHFTTPETMISRLMREMQRERVHLSVVRGAGGRTEGIVTLEDILEEIVGEIEDERAIHSGKLTRRRG